MTHSGNRILTLAYRAVDEQWGPGRFEDGKQLFQAFSTLPSVQRIENWKAYCSKEWLRKILDALPSEEVLHQELRDAIQLIANQNFPPQVVAWASPFVSIFSLFCGNLRDGIEFQLLLAQVRNSGTLGHINIGELARVRYDFVTNLAPFIDLADAVEGGRLSLSQAIEKALTPEITTSIREESLAALPVEVKSLAQTNRRLAYIFACFGDAVASYNANLSFQVQVECAIWVGLLGYDDEDPQFIIERLQRALILCQQQEDQEREAEVLYILGEVYRSPHYLRLPQAHESYRRANELLDVGEHNLGRARTLLTLGEIELFRRDYEEAKESYAQAFSLFQEGEDSHGQAKVLYAMGQLSVLQGSSDRARDFFKWALSEYANNKDLTGLFHSFRSLGDLTDAPVNHLLALAYRAVEEQWDLELLREMGQSRQIFHSFPSFKGCAASRNIRRHPGNRDSGPSPSGCLLGQYAPHTSLADVL